jgi:hypothetical protein
LDDPWGYIVEAKDWTNDPGHEPDGWPPPPDDWDWDDVTYDEDCDGSYMKVWTGGHVVDECCVWATLERNGIILSHSAGVVTDSGSFSGYYLNIPLDGLQLDAHLYDVSLYLSPEIQDVGNATSSISRSIQVDMGTFPDQLRLELASRTKAPLPKALDGGAPMCMLLSSPTPLALTVSYFGNFTGMMIVEGEDEKPNIQWWISGDNSVAGSISDDGQFEAYALSPKFGDIWVHARDTARALEDSVTIIIEEVAPDGCSAQAHQYAGVRDSTGECYTGVSCDLTTYYGKLCNGLDTSVQAHSLAYMAVVKHPFSNSKWAQTGYVRLRKRGIFGFRECWFIEVQGDNHRVKGAIAPYFEGPNPGTVNSYEILVDSIDGRWCAFFNGPFRDSLQDNYWIRTYGTYIDFSGEILQPETDMPGTSSSKVLFSNCRYSTQSEFWDHVPDLNGNPNNAHYSDWNEWRVVIDGDDALEIWDVNPR